MVFSKRRVCKIRLQLMIDGENINDVQKTKFLRIIIDNKLKWKDHISYITGKVSRGVGMIIKARNYLKRNGLRRLYLQLQPSSSMNGSVRPSGRLSVRPSVTPFSLCSHRDHRIIMKFSGVITNDRSDVLAKCQGQRSNIKVTQAKPQFSHFRIVTPVWIHIWWWNGAHSLILLGTGALFWRSSVKFQCHTAKKIVDFDPNWAFPDCNSNLISPVAMKWCTTPEAA